MMSSTLFGSDFKSRKAIASPPNPLDLSTVVSLYPKEVVEKKWTIQPGVFIIPSGSVEKPSFTVVGSSSWWRDFDPEQPLFEVVQSSMVIAESICIDYCNGLLGYTRAHSQPGLFWIPGEFDNLEDVKKAFFKKLNISGLDLYNRAIKMQRNYWERLVKLADAGWSKTNGNPYVIMEDMRLAATILGFKDKPWMKDIQMLEMINCPMCGVSCNPAYPMCSNCKAIINPEKAKELNIQFSK